MKPLRVLLLVLAVIVCVQIVYSLQNKASQAAASRATEAPTGFDNQFNGALSNSQKSQILTFLRPL